MAHYDGDPVMMGEDLDVRIVQRDCACLRPAMRRRTRPTSSSVPRDYINGLKQLNRLYFQRLAEELKELKRQGGN